MKKRITIIGLLAGVGVVLASILLTDHNYFAYTDGNGQWHPSINAQKDRANFVRDYGCISSHIDSYLTVEDSDRGTIPIVTKSEGFTSYRCVLTDKDTGASTVANIDIYDNEVQP